MIGSISDKKGWIYVSLRKPQDWKLPTFFPLVDSMFNKIKNEYQTKARKVAFDVSDMEYIDSTMISLFLQTIRLTEPNRNAIIVSSQNTTELLCLLGLDRLCDIFKSKPEWENAQT